MPYFMVMMRGEGIRLVGEEPKDDIVGFYTTRLVRAASADAAEYKAQALLLEEWSAPPYSESNRGAAPRLTVESVTETGLLSSLRFKNSGHTFYTQED